MIYPEVFAVTVSNNPMLEGDELGDDAVFEGVVDTFYEGVVVEDKSDAAMVYEGVVEGISDVAMEPTTTCNEEFPEGDLDETDETYVTQFLDAIDAAGLTEEDCNAKIDEATKADGHIDHDIADRIIEELSSLASESLATDGGLEQEASDGEIEGGAPSEVMEDDDDYDLYNVYPSSVDEFTSASEVRLEINDVLSNDGSRNGDDDDVVDDDDKTDVYKSYGRRSRSSILLRRRSSIDLVEEAQPHVFSVRYVDSKECMSVWLMENPDANGDGAFSNPSEPTRVLQLSTGKACFMVLRWFLCGSEARGNAIALASTLPGTSGVKCGYGTHLLARFSGLADH